MVARRFALATLLVSSAAAHAALGTPTLSSPANGSTDWLFNLPSSGARKALEWTAVTSATGYHVVVSSDATFSFLRDGASPTCLNTCVVVATTGASAKASDFAFWKWEAKTYYWKVRARNAAGWGAWSGVRTFATTSRSSIGTNALTYSVSPASIETGTGGVSTTWLTEISGGDGARLIAAMKIYRLSGLTGVPASGSTVFRNMDTALTNPNTTSTSLAWATNERSQLIARIAATRTGWTLTDPATGQAAMTRLGVRAQCKEFADRMVASGGGSNRTYPSGSAVSSGLDVRPGMYVFRYVNGSAAHAAIANAVVFDAFGGVSANLSESNWGGGWNSNPGGQVPWSRTVQHSRTVSITASGEYRAFTN